MHPKAVTTASLGVRPILARLIQGASLAGLACLGLAAFAQAAASGANPADPARQVEGLIVRLKQAPSHRELAQEPRKAALETRRWDELIERAGSTRRPGETALRRSAVGRDQMLLHFAQPITAAEAEARAAQLRAQPDVEWVAPNLREQRQQAVVASPTDPMFAQQWWLQTAAGSNANTIAQRRRGVPGFAEAWATGLAGAGGAPGVVVAVLDTGITAHPELQGRLLGGRDLVSDDFFSRDGQPGRDDDPSDPGDWIDASELSDPRLARCSAAASTWHGTAVAGLIAANADNGIGVASVLRQGMLLPVRVAGRCGATVADIIDGMRWAAGLEVDGLRNPYPARIINLSYGSANVCGREYQDTIDELRTLGVVVVAAAGNARGTVARPANCRGVVGVTALNRDGFKAYYASFGAALSATGLATVGGDDAGGSATLADGGLVTLGNDGTTSPGAARYAAFYGTSFAAPLAAGTLAMMLAVNPSLSADQLIDGLLRSARPHVSSPMLGNCSALNAGHCLCTSETCGAGILDARQALRYALAPDAYTPPVWPAVQLEAPELAQAALATAQAVNPATPSATESGQGGGASSVGWLLMLLAAAAALPRRADAAPQASATLGPAPPTAIKAARRRA